MISPWEKAWTTSIHYSLCLYIHTNTHSRNNFQEKNLLPMYLCYYWWLVKDSIECDLIFFFLQYHCNRTNPFLFSIKSNVVFIPQRNVIKFNQSKRINQMTLSILSYHCTIALFKISNDMEWRYLSSNIPYVLIIIITILKIQIQ